MITTDNSSTGKPREKKMLRIMCRHACSTTLCLPPNRQTQADTPAKHKKRKCYYVPY